ncbi:MAG TPA: transcriptional regulator [Candidatus Nitrosotalea sp.]|nr:transcriptional regulator [Candidatus Nitrosotalea sp.]
MPEIWLSYGPTDVVLDVRAENLEKQIGSGGVNLTDSEIASKLESIDMSKPTEFVIMEHSKIVQKVVSILLDVCTKKSLPKPKFLADKSNLNFIKNVFSDPTISVSEFDASQFSNANLIFIGEMEFDGLFGYNTMSTKLLRRFGKDNMLEAYERREGNLPLPGYELQPMQVAKKFTDGFEISSIEIIANQTGLIDIATGHPSSTFSLSKSLSSVAMHETEKHRVAIVSTGKEASNETLSRSLSSVWNCSGAIREEGLVILLAECKNGLGSEAIQQYVEGRMSLDRLKNPSKYVDGMEDLLFLTEMRKKFTIGIVSILPYLYTKDKLEMIPFSGAKETIDYVLKTYGDRQKITIISDGSHVLLR